MEELLRILTGAAGGLLTKEAYEKLGEIGAQGYEELAGYTTESGEFVPGLADKLSGMLEFQPYTVTSATGGQFGMTRDPDTGQMTYQMATSPEEQAFQQQQLERAGMFFGQAAMPIEEREADILAKIKASRAQDISDQRTALEQRLAAQGRLGTQTAMFGGTPEALTLEKAIADSERKAVLDAMQFAGQEQQRQAQLGSGMLASGYIPQAQLLSALQPGMTAAERQRQALSQQAGAYGETYTSGLQALLQSGLGQAALVGNLGSGLAGAALSGLFA